MSIDIAQLEKLHAKFFTDPDWSIMEDFILSYIEPFRSVANIPTKLTNDQIATEVRGRQLMVEQLEKFLDDARMIKSRKNLKNTNPYR